MTRRRVRKSRIIRRILAIWIFLFIALVILAALHFIGWIILTTAIAGLAYSAGRYPQWRATRKIRISNEYGKGWHGSEITSSGRIDRIDTVSPYPDEIRNRIIADPRSGARPLMDGDTDDAGSY